MVFAAGAVLFVSVHDLVAMASPRYASTREACEAGIKAEVQNIVLYERLMRSTSQQDPRANEQKT